jgi:hypothetical protein
MTTIDGANEVRSIGRHGDRVRFVNIAAATRSDRGRAAAQPAIGEIRILLGMGS